MSCKNCLPDFNQVSFFVLVKSKALDDALEQVCQSAELILDLESTPMKIAVICHLDYPIASPFAGGLETHTWHLCSALIKRGHKVTTFASGDSDPRLNVRGIVKTSLHLASSASLPERESIKQRAYQHTLQQICQSDFDIIHNNSLNTLPLLQAGGLNKPMVTVLHTPPFKKLSAAVALAAKSAHACFVSVSNAVALQWQPFANSRVIYNGIDVDSWPFQIQEYSLHLEISGHHRWQHLLLHYVPLLAAECLHLIEQSVDA